MIRRIDRRGDLRDAVAAPGRHGAGEDAKADYAFVLTKAMLLGNVAVRMGKPIEYDGQKGEITNHPDANRLIAPPPRAGWEL